MAIPYSGGVITKTLLPRDNTGFLTQICNNLLNSGWTERTAIAPWIGFYTNTSPDDGNHFQPTRYHQSYIWRNSPSLPNEVLTGSPYNAWNRMGQKLLDDGIIKSYNIAVEYWSWLYGYMSNIRMIYNDANVATVHLLASYENPDSRYDWSMRYTFDSNYGWYRGGNFWSFGYRVFDSVPTEQGLKIRIAVGWQINSAGNVVPCIRMLTTDGVLDPFAAYDPTRTDFWNSLPVWAPCVDSLETVDYEMICGPCWFCLYAKEVLAGRRWIYGGVIKLLETMTPIRASITPGVTTTVKYNSAHNQYVGSYISLSGIDPIDDGPIITSKLLRVVEVVDDVTLRVDVDTSGHYYTSDGIAGDDKHPVNAAFIIAPDLTNVGAPRVSMSSGTGQKGEAYFWNTNVWTPGGTGTSANNNGTTNNSARFPLRSSRTWPAGRAQIYEPFVGWSEALNSSNNLIRGMLYDAVAMNRSYNLDSEITDKSLDNHNWHQFTDAGAGGSIHLLLP